MSQKFSLAFGDVVNHRIPEIALIHPTAVITRAHSVRLLCYYQYACAAVGGFRKKLGFHFNDIFEECCDFGFGSASARVAKLVVKKS